MEPGRQRRPGQHNSAPNQKCTSQQPQTSQGSADSERYERAHEVTQQWGWCCSGASPWEISREIPTIERRGGMIMPPLQRIRVTRQNGEKRAPPLRGGGSSSSGGAAGTIIIFIISSRRWRAQRGLVLGCSQPRRLHPERYRLATARGGALPWLWGSDQGPFFPVFFLWATNS